MIGTRVLVAAVAAVALLPWHAAAQGGSPPDRPARPEVTAASHDSVTLSWTDPGDASITGYQVLRRSRDADAAGVFAVVEDDTGSAATSYTDTTVEASTRYVYRVKARNAHGLSAPSGFVRADVPAAPEPVTDLGDITDSRGAQSTEGELQGSAGTLDRYRFTLGMTMTVDLKLRRQDADADLILQDAQAVTVAESREAGTANERITRRLTAGTHTVLVEAQEAAANAYRLVYEAVAGTNPHDLGDITERGWDPANGPYVDSSVGGAGNLFDYYSLTLSEPKTVHLLVTAQEGGTVLLLEDGDGDVVARSRTSGTADEVTEQALDAGTWYIGIRPVTKDSSLSYRLRYGVSDPATTDDHADEPAGATPLAEGSTVTGEVGTEQDEDWFAAELEKGRTYRLDLTGASGPFVHEIQDGTGAVISEDLANIKRTAPAEDAKDEILFGDGWTEITPKDTGTYYIGIKNGKGTGGFTLGLRNMHDDFPAGTATTGTVAVGGSTTGDIESVGDRDWFGVSLTAGGIYRIDVMGAQSGSGTLRDPVLAGVFDSGGDAIAGTADDDSGAGTDSRTFLVAGATATHYIEAAGSGTRRGTYTVAVTEITDDHPDDDTTTATVTVDGSEQGEIEYAGDHDWFEVTLTANKTYRFNLMGSWTGNGTLLDPYLDGVHDSTGSLLEGTQDNDGGARWNARVDLEITSGGTHYVAAGGYTAGTYTLEVLDITSGVPDDYPNDDTTTAEVTVGDSATGSIDYALDADWFEVTLTGGTTYHVDVMGSGVGQGTLDQPILTGILDSGGNRITDASVDYRDGVRWSEKAVFTPTASGDNAYYVAVTSNFNREGTYTVAVTDMTPDQADDYTAATDTTALVAAGGSASGRIEQAGDRDWIKATLMAGKVYRFDLRGASSGEGTLVNPELREIRNSGGSPIRGTQGKYTSLSDDEWVYFTPGSTGDYYVAVGAGPADVGGREGTYTLSLTNITDMLTDDFGASTSDHGTVAVDESVTGEIGHPGDRDWFKVSLEADQEYQFDLKGGPTGDGLPGYGTMDDPRLHKIRDSNGDSIAGTSDNDSGKGNYSRVTYTPSDTGDFYLVAGGDGGTYELSVTELDDDDYTATTATTGSVAVGGSATGLIEAEGDRDWFAVTLTAGTAYRFELKGARTADGTLIDPQLGGIHDPGGSLIAGTSDDDGGIGLNSELTFTATSTGVHYVEAASSGDWEGSYTLYVTAT